MGRRKIIIREHAAESIASAAWFIESKGMIATAEKFSDAAYDSIYALGDNRITHNYCRDPERSLLGLKCVPFKKKYTIVFYESDDEIIVHDFLPGKLIHW